MQVFTEVVRHFFPQTTCQSVQDLEPSAPLAFKSRCLQKTCKWAGGTSYMIYFVVQGSNRVMLRDNIPASEFWSSIATDRQLLVLRGRLFMPHSMLWSSATCCDGSPWSCFSRFARAFANPTIATRAAYCVSPSHFSFRIQSTVTTACCG